MLLIFWSIEGLGLGSDKNKWFNLDNKKVFTIVILPIGVKCLLFQLLIILQISVICFEKLISVHSVRSTESDNPNILKQIVSHWRFSRNSFSLQYFFFPIHTTWVFSVFTRRPDNDPKLLKHLKQPARTEMFHLILMLCHQRTNWAWFLYFRRKYPLFFYYLI